MPPIHMPLAFDAAILSRTRSAVTSRSNWAKDSSTWSVSRPMLVVVLNDWVTLTKLAPAFSSTSTILGEVGEAAGQPIDLVDHDDVDLAGDNVGQQRFSPGRSMLPPENPPSS